MLAKYGEGASGCLYRTRNPTSGKCNNGYLGRGDRSWTLSERGEGDGQTALKKKGLACHNHVPEAISTQRLPRAGPYMRRTGHLKSGCSVEDIDRNKGGHTPAPLSVAQRRSKGRGDKSTPLAEAEWGSELEAGIERTSHLTGRPEWRYW
ncbi:hypothetical protein DENSPDRAFT_855511 [Dentipellis sp. KUC8613]|nr:hypothetical protein DENSPDRAFT_855511 [Dentipellis sp. KUC8613]